MKLLIITGASKGIGLVTAKKFHSENWQVVNISRSPSSYEWMQHISQDLSKTIESDVLNKITAQCSQAEKVCLIHNASNFFSDSILDFNLNLFEESLRLNLENPLVITRTLINFLKEHSSIIFIGSTLSEKAAPNALSYITVKHGVVGLMKSMCEDIAIKKIHTCCICPGFTNTEMLSSRIKNNPEILAKITHTQLLNRLVEPEEIAELIWFCANNPSVNGSVLHANLGQRG